MSDVNEKLEVAFCEWWRSMNLALIPLESTRSTFKAGWDAGVEHRPPIRVELATDASGESCEIIDTCMHKERLQTKPNRGLEVKSNKLDHHLPWQILRGPLR